MKQIGLRRNFGRSGRGACFMRDLHGLSAEAITEIAGYIKRDNMEYVNSNARPVKVKDTFYTRYGKRFIDIIIAMFALTIAFPFNLVIAIITYFDVGRPILFKQTRMGRDNRRFTIYNLRWMKTIDNSHRECAARRPTSCATRTTKSFGRGFRHQSGHFKPAAAAERGAFRRPSESAPIHRTA